jgi:hypothetical protein
MVDWNNKLVIPLTMEPNVRGEKKTSSFIYFLIFLVLIGLGYLAYTLVNKQADKDVDKNTNTQQENEQDNEDETPEPDITDDEETDVVVTGGDFSNFKTTQQSVGTLSENTGMYYTLTSLTNSANTGFHRFEFTVTGKQSDSNVPYATAGYAPSLGAIRVDLRGVTTDNSGIGYQKSLEINKEGVVKIYHNVSADQTQELYDIGVSKETPFLFTATESGSNSWTITLDVKYPGVSTIAGDLDLGSKAFSKDTQSIVGATRNDGARVSSYSYSSSGGVLSVVFEVKGSSSKPIPSATAGYDGEGKLVLRFTDIVSDAIAKMPAALTMSGGVTMVWEMDGSNASKYTFDGASKEYKLYGGTNPNQVIIEIRL